MRETSPVGQTSLRRTAISATGLSTARSSSTTGAPTISMAATSSGESKVSEPSIVAALVAGKFLAEPDDAVFAAIEARRLRR